MFNVSIEPSVFALEPEFKRVVVGVRLPTSPAFLHEFESELRAAESDYRERHDDSAIATHPHLIAWRAAFRKFGANPTDYRPSVDALIRRVTKGNPLPSIHPLVDLGTILSLRYVLPVGVHPVEDRQMLVLRVTRQDDVFQPPAGDPEQPAVGEVVFASEAEVHTRRWVWRQSQGSMIAPTTLTAEFNLDALPPVGVPELHQASADLLSLLARLPGARTGIATLDARRRSAGIEL